MTVALAAFPEQRKERLHQHKTAAANRRRLDMSIADQLVKLSPPQTCDLTSLRYRAS
jgi:hypothetical protein